MALVADDEDAIRSLVQRKLEQEGYRVLTAADGQACLDLWNKERPPVVIVDLRMPGMRGEEVVRQIKAESPATVAIVMTGHGSLDSAVDMLATGCDGYLLKPLSDLSVVPLTIQQARERQRLLLRGTLLERSSRAQTRALVEVGEGLVNPVSRLQENLGALRAAAADGDLEEVSALLEDADKQMEALAEVLEVLSRTNASSE